MNFIKRVILFFKNILKKETNIKMIDAVSTKKENNIFKYSLKINSIQVNKKKKVETPICFGDGLGIQKKISC